MTVDNPIITSPVLIPYTPDCEYQYGEEVLPPEKIEYLAKSFNKYKIIDLQHEFTKRLINHEKPIPRGKLLKSYISNEKLHLKGLDGLIREYPEGTWIISVEITEPEAVKLYKDSALTGLSITVKEKEHADAIIQYLNDKNIPYLPQDIVDAEKGFYKKPKRILMKDVENPVAFTVSLVKQPCVYGAKFCKNSCLIVNEGKLKENKILNLKEKIKSELNSIIDGLDMEEAIKEDIAESEKEEIEESEKEEIPEEESEKDSEKCGEGKTKTIYGRKVKSSQSTKSDIEEESVKDGDGDGNGDGNGEGGNETPAGGENSGEQGGTQTPAGEQGSGEQTTGDDETEAETEEEEEEEDNSSSKGKTKKEVKKEAKKEDLAEAETESESDKVLYLAQDDVESLISTTLRKYADEIEEMVFDGIQEALDDYLFANEMSYKEDVKEEETEEEEKEPEEEEVEEEAQKEYATPEMVQSMFDEQFASFKSTIMDGIKEAQKESIKSYSKAINPSDDGFKQETQKETFKPRVERDFNGCRIRKRK